MRVKRDCYLFVLLPLLLVYAGVLNGQSCPKGVRQNCVYGCGRYTDLNKDGYCDYSFVTLPEKQEPPKDTTNTTRRDTLKKVELTSPKPSDRSDKASGEKPGRKVPSPVAPGKPSMNDIREDPAGAAEGHGDATSRESGAAVIPPIASDFVPSGQDPVYDLILVSVITILLYFLTLVLYRENIIKRMHHRKFWNLMLLLTFLVSCLFGLFLVIQINYHIAMGIYGTLLYWHVEIGIAMTLIAIIHILWHFTYFRNMLKKW